MIGYGLVLVISKEYLHQQKLSEITNVSATNSSMTSLYQNDFSNQFGLDLVHYDANRNEKVVLRYCGFGDSQVVALINRPKLGWLDLSCSFQKLLMSSSAKPVIPLTVWKFILLVPN